MPDPIWTFDESLHLYRNAAGVIVPSVTQIIEAAGLNNGISKIPAGILQRKADIGTQTHIAADLLDDGASLDDLDVDPAVMPYAKAYCQFLEDNRPKWEVREQRFVATVTRMEYGGCVDRAGKLGNQTVVIDIKTSREVGRHWGVQLAGYRLGLPHAGEPVALHLLPDGKYNLVPFPDETAVFLAALRIAWWKREESNRILDAAAKEISVP